MLGLNCFVGMESKVLVHFKFSLVLFHLIIFALVYPIDSELSESLIHLANIFIALKEGIIVRVKTDEVSF